MPTVPSHSRKKFTFVSTPAGDRLQRERMLSPSDLDVPHPAFRIGENSAQEVSSELSMNKTSKGSGEEVPLPSDEATFPDLSALLQTTHEMVKEKDLSVDVVIKTPESLDQPATHVLHTVDVNTDCETANVAASTILETPTPDIVRQKMSALGLDNDHYPPNSPTISGAVSYDGIWVELDVCLPDGDGAPTHPVVNGDKDIFGEAKGAENVSAPSKEAPPPPGYFWERPEQQSHQLAKPVVRPGVSKCVNRPQSDDQASKLSRVEVGVCIEAIPPGLTPRLLLSQLRGGAVHSMKVFKPQGVNGAKIAAVFFKDAQAADRSFEWHQQNPLVLQGYKLTISRRLPPTVLAVLKNELPFQVFRPGETRCLRLRNIPAETCDFTYIYRWVDIHIAGIPMEGSQFNHGAATAILSFMTIRDAVNVKRSLLAAKSRDRQWKGLRVEFAQDPCGYGM